MKKINCYVINLKKDVEKKQHMLSLTKENQISPYFVDAVLGNELGESEISKVYSKREAISHGGRALTKGEIGCALSHISIYKDIIANNIELDLKILTLFENCH